MASFTIDSTEQGVSQKTLSASTVDTITFTDDHPEAVEILNEGSVGISGTTNGTTPTVDGENTFYVPPNSVRTVDLPQSAGTVEVKLISSGTPKYSVAKA